jgi:hypothetical protein
MQLYGKDPRTVTLDGLVYDSGELVGVLRRLPLANGYKTTLLVLASTAPIVQKMPVAVTGEEDVKTPAGQYRAYRVEVNGSSTYWISTDRSRYLVKFEQGAMMSSELLAIRRAGQTSVYTNNQPGFGFSLNVPAGWTADEANIGPIKMGAASVGPANNDKRMVQLVDSDSSALVTLTVELRNSATAPTQAEMRKEAMNNPSEPSFLAQKMRVDTLQDRRVGGHAALRWIADATSAMNNSPVIAYNVWVRSKALKAQFLAKVDPEDFARLQPQLDAIVDSLTLR